MAATLTDSGEQTLTYFSIPIEKTETTPDGDVVVFGKATDGSVDSDGQIVDTSWSAKALQEWLDSAGNVRVQHQSQRDPAGKGLEVSYGPDGHYVKSLIVEPVAKRLVEKGVLTAYSVGIARPVIEPDISGKARGGIIKGGKLVELSLVDRPANKNCGIQLVKSEGDADPEWTGKVWGDEELLTKAGAGTATPATADADPEDQPEYDKPVEPGTVPTQPADPTVTKSVTLELPEDVAVTFTPGDLAKMLDRKQGVPAPDAEKRDFDPNVGEHGTDRDKMPGADFAGRDRSFPIHSQSDVSDALQSIGRAGSDNYSHDQLRANIIRIARRKGFSVPEDSDKPKKSKKNKAGVLTDELLAEIIKTVTCDACKGTGKVDGKPCPSCSANKGLNRMDADDHDSDTDADEDDKGADKAAKKPGKGKKMPPWLNKPDDDDKDDSDSDSKSDKGGTPADGVTGMHASPVPAHREPDGHAIEEMESDAGLQDGDNEKPTRLESQMGDCKMETDAVLMFKSLGVEHQLGVLHDLCCPAYGPEDVAKAHPGADFANIDIEWFARKAMDLAATGTLADASRATLAWSHARTLKGLTTSEMVSLQERAHKAFRDANPGPGSAPTPGSISPQKYHRPYLSAGHAAESASEHAKEPSATVPSGQISAEQFGRGFISTGHAADSPANKGTGVPQSVDYVPVVRENAQAAMRAMHDHVAQTFPDVCPMELSRDSHQVTSNPVPVPQGTPATSAARVGQVHKDEDTSADEQIEKLLADAEAEKAQKKMRKKLGKKVLAGKMTVDEARSRLGRNATQKSDEPEPEVQKAVSLESAVPVWNGTPPVWVTNGGTSPDAVKSAIDSALSPLLARLEAQDELLRKQAQMLDTLADQPDPAVAPFKGLAANPQKMASAHPAGASSVAEVAGRTQAMMLRELETQWRTAAHPAEREAAWQSIMKLRGLNSQ